MGYRRRIRPAAIALFLALGLTLAMTPTAGAHYSQCTTNRFCLWEHSSYNGKFYSSTGSVARVGTSFNDLATSAWNRTPYWVTVFEHDDHVPGSVCNVTLCFKLCYVLPPGGSTAAFPTPFNDRASSFAVNHREPNCIT